MPSDAPGTEAAREAVATTLHLRETHKQESDPLQRSVDRITAFVGRPGFIAGVLLAMMGWVAANLALQRLHLGVLDPPPFVGLAEMISVLSLFVAISILATQRREDRLAEHRAQLILELLVVNDRKISKIIQLLEEMRRDSSGIRDRVDDEALSMIQPSDTQAVLRAIKEVVADEGTP